MPCPLPRRPRPHCSPHSLPAPLRMKRCHPMMRRHRLSSMVSEDLDGKGSSLPISSQSLLNERVCLYHKGVLPVPCNAVPIPKSPSSSWAALVCNTHSRPGALAVYSRETEQRRLTLQLARPRAPSLLGTDLECKRQLSHSPNWGPL